jgi:hypothetical protein
MAAYEVARVVAYVGAYEPALEVAWAAVLGTRFAAALEMKLVAGRILAAFGTQESSYQMMTPVA